MGNGNGIVKCDDEGVEIEYLRTFVVMVLCDKIEA
jgi:hypothetical protein